MTKLQNRQKKTLYLNGMCVFRTKFERTKSKTKSDICYIFSKDIRIQLKGINARQLQQPIMQ